MPRRNPTTALSKSDICRLTATASAPAQPPTTSAFKAWFRGSKVVDGKGKPLVVFHGTTAGEFEAFRPHIRKNEQLGFGVHFTESRAFAESYAHDPTVARKQPAAVKGKHPHVFEVYLRVTNPLRANEICEDGTPEFALARKLAGPRLFTQTAENGKKIAMPQAAIDSTSSERAERLIREAGFDGVKYVAQLSQATGYGRRKTGEAVSWVVFEPTQIKAVDNCGDFDGSNPNIRRNPAGISSGDDASIPAEWDTLQAVAQAGRLARTQMSPDTRRRAVMLFHAGLLDREQTESNETWYWLTKQGQAQLGGRKPAGDVSHPAGDVSKPLGFHRWFKQSQVVDPKGQPLVVYHGTMTADAFEVFDPQRSTFDQKGNRFGSWFAEDPVYASVWAGGARGLPEGGKGGRVYPVYLSIQNPRRYEGSAGWAKLLSDFKAATGTPFNKATLDDCERFRRALNSEGVDGIIVSRFTGDASLGGDAEQTFYVTLYPGQVKSATGNNGDFDGANPNIRRNPAGGCGVKDVFAGWKGKVIWRTEHKYGLAIAPTTNVHHVKQYILWKGVNTSKLGTYRSRKDAYDGALRHVTEGKVWQESDALARKTARSTGFKVALYEVNDPEAPYLTVCEEHGDAVRHGSKEIAESYLGHPEDWCEGCRYHGGIPEQE